MVLSGHLSPDPGIMFWPALGLTAAAQSDLNFHVALLSLLVVTGADDAPHAETFIAIDPRDMWCMDTCSMSLCLHELILHDAVTGLKLEESKHVQMFDGINNAWWS